MSADMDRFAIPGAGRLAVGSLEALSELRRDVFHSVGPRYGAGILYGIGYTEGLIDALRVTRGFSQSSITSPTLVGPPLPLLFKPTSGSLATRFGGQLTHSVEAKLHQRTPETAESSACSVTAGYASGWYTELLGAPILVKETHCCARGDGSCSFEARPLEEWSGDRQMAEILIYIDVEALRQRARAALARTDMIDLDEDEDELIGFDPGSPAVHVWGPVMILPYSGADDCSAAIDTIVGDVGTGQVRVVLLDLLGMRLDSIEAAGVTQVLSYLHHHEMESILVGLTSGEGDRLGLPLGGTLCVSDMAQGIALGFQMINERTS